MKPYSPPASLLTRGASKPPIFPEAIDRPDQAPCQELLFAARPLAGGRFAYDGVDRAFAALLRLPSGKVYGLDIFQCMSDADANSVCEVLQACLEENAEVRVHHRLALGGLLRDVETTVFPLESEAGDVARLIGRHRIVSEMSEEQEPDDRARRGLDLASIQEGVQQRIASELHDSTCQQLVAASLGLMRIRACRGATNGVDGLCDEVEASIDCALREIRSLTYMLHPQDVMAEGLKTTIERYARGFAARTSLRVRLGIDARVDGLPYDDQRSLLRVVQEGLANIFRHAKATQVEILFKTTGDQFRLTISDNGSGFPSQRVNRLGMSIGVGIPAMRTRLAQLGGSLEIRSAPRSSGTMLCAVFPLRDAVKGRRRRVSLQSWRTSAGLRTET